MDGGTHQTICCSVLLAAACLLIPIGCRPAIESSPDAVSLPLLQRDPFEEAGPSENWPGWRGFNGSGISPSGRPPINFNAREGYRWKVTVPGKGLSSPVVWGDRVLLTSAVGPSDPPMLVVLCFRRSDGKLLWRAEAGPAIGPTHRKNGFASATLATDGERIVAFFGSTGLFCFDFDGKNIWQTPLGKLEHIWGTAASPVLHGDLVIQVCDSKADSYIAGFDKQTGIEVWRTTRPSLGCWSTPVFVEADVDGATRTEMIVNGTQARGDANRLVIAYDPTDGQPFWQVGGTTELVTPTTLFAAGLIYCASGRNGPIIAIRPGGRDDVTDTRVVWKIGRGGPYIPSGVAYRNRLYFVSDHGEITCYNAGNGQTIWKQRLRGPFTSSLVAADGRLHAVSERGIVYVLVAGDEFELLAENDLEEGCLTTPSIVGRELFIRTNQHLYCMEDIAPAKPAME